MLKIMIGSGKEDTVEFNGSGAELFQCISIVILSLRKALAAGDPRAAAAFRRSLQLAILSPDFWSRDPGVEDFVSIVRPREAASGNEERK